MEQQHGESHERTYSPPLPDLSLKRSLPSGIPPQVIKFTPEMIQQVTIGNMSVQLVTIVKITDISVCGGMNILLPAVIVSRSCGCQVFDKSVSIMADNKERLDRSSCVAYGKQFDW